MTALLLLGLARAEPLVLRVHDAEELLQAPVQVRVAGDHHDTLVGLADRGTPPDVLADDGVFTALVDPAPEGARLRFEVLDGAAQAFTTEVDAPTGTQRELDLGLRGGKLGLKTGELPGASGAAASQGPVPAGAREAWLLAALGWACTLSLLLHRRQREG